jgi:allantoinase
VTASEFDLVLRAPRESPRSGRWVLADRDGWVAAIEPLEACERTITLADDEVLRPGLIDTTSTSTSRPDEWEGFASATLASAGGITTLIDMPPQLDSP